MSLFTSVPTSAQGKVSVRAVLHVRDLIEAEGLSWPTLLALAHLDRNLADAGAAWIAWEDYARLCRAAAELCGSIEGLRTLSRRWGHGKQLQPVRRLTRACVSSEALYRILTTVTLTFIFKNIFSTEITPAGEGGQLRLRIRLMPGFEGCLEWFVSTAGLLEGYPTVLGYPRAEVTTEELSPHHGVYLITPPRFRTLPNRIRAWFETPLRVQDAATVLTTQQDALNENYRELERQKQDLEAVLRCSSEPVTIVADGRILFANTAMADLLGAISAQSLEGESMQRWVDEETLQSLREWALSKPAQSERRETRVRLAENRTKRVEVAAPRPVTWHHRPAMLWIMADIDERRALEIALAEATEREQRRIADDLHDGLGQEMTAIALQLKVLETTLSRAGRDEAEELAKLVQQVSAAARHARDIAHGLAPRLVVERGLMVALSWLAGHTAELFFMTVNIECLDPADLISRGVTVNRALAIYRAAQEILSNARRHGRARTVDIVVTRDTSTLRLVFNDDGVGLANLEAEEEKGAGLRIIKHRLRAVGGQAQFGTRSDGKSGLSITLSVPWHPPREEPPRDSLPPLTGSRVLQLGETARVLVVDDHAIVREGVVRWLVQTGEFEIIREADSAQSALYPPMSPPPDIAVVDLYLNGESGLDLMRELRNHYPNLQLVAFSMAAPELYEKEAKRAGARAYITKQAGPKELLRALREAVSRSA